MAAVGDQSRPGSLLNLRSFGHDREPCGCLENVDSLGRERMIMPVLAAFLGSTDRSFFTADLVAKTLDQHPPYPEKG